MTDTIRFAPLNDGSEEDCQCARCGSSAVFVDCESCGSRGYHESDDPEWPYDYRCDDCNGSGGWWMCCSGVEWCQAHPAPGREAIENGKIEWFSVAPADREPGKPAAAVHEETPE